MAGILIAVLGIAVLVIAVIALRNPKQTSSQAGTATQTVVAPSGSSGSKSSPASSSKSASRSASTSASRSASKSSSTNSVKSVPLIVLNDTRTSNLARDAARRFENGGWKVTSFDENFSNTILSTAAYYDPNAKGSQKAANALQQQYPTIQRVVARFPQLPSGPVVVVLTSGYSSN